MAEVIDIRRGRRRELAARPCPSWCVYHLHSDDALIPPDQQWCSHHGPRFRLTYRDPRPGGASPPDREIVIEIGRHDQAGRAGVPYLGIDAIGKNVGDDIVPGRLHAAEPMSVDDADRFARLLLQAVGAARRTGRNCGSTGAQTRAARPGRPPNNIESAENGGTSGNVSGKDASSSPDSSPT
jgi:hypothetical protein